MLDCLDQNFVNAWILHRDLKALAADPRADAELRAAAETALARIREHRLMPVGIQVLSPKGELLAKASVNGDRLMGRGAAAKYLRILREGLEAQKR